MARPWLRALVVALAVAAILSVPAGARSGGIAPRGRPHAGAAAARRAPAQLASVRSGLGSGPNAQGIDIADYQDARGPIQWNVVATQYQFVFIKATEGNYYVDPYYAGDAASASAAGLYVGAYEFATPDDASGEAEANYFLQQVRYAMGRKMLIPMVDLEMNPYGDTCYGLSPSAMVSWIQSYVATIHAVLGVKPIIYTQTRWWNDCTGGSSAFSDDPLWVGSDGTTSMAAPGTAVPPGFTGWSIWQTPDGAAAGVTGEVDIDTFNGPVGDLRSHLTAPAWAQARLAQSLGLCCLG